MAALKILIVDDSSTDRINLKTIVTNNGYDVITANNGSEAISKALAEKPNLIFMDIIMDEMDGYSACRELSKNNETKHIPVVFVSSKNQKADTIWAEKQGGRGLVSKPYTEEQIVEKLIALA